MLSNIWIFSLLRLLSSSVAISPPSSTLPHVVAGSAKRSNNNSPPLRLLLRIFFPSLVLIFLSAVVLITKRDLNVKEIYSSAAFSSFRFFLGARQKLRRSHSCATLTRARFPGSQIKALNLIFTRVFPVYSQLSLLILRLRHYGQFYQRRNSLRTKPQLKNHFSAIQTLQNNSKISKVATSFSPVSRPHLCAHLSSMVPATLARLASLFEREFT